ncbi:MAG: molybdenum cofactor guanylyltransferase [Candidatus Limnocylindrales bacterium]
MTESTSTTGIVLAGGRSTRFGDADKLGADLAGRPLFHHAVLALVTLCDEIVVVIAADGDVPPLPDDAGAPVRVARDRVAGLGPLAGLVAGLESTAAELVLVAGGDQPRLTRPLLALLTGSIGAADAAVLAEHGRPRPIPAALRRSAAMAAARARLTSDQRSLRALIADLAPVVVPERTWRQVDPDGLWRRDVDRPEDLARA